MSIPAEEWAWCGYPGHFIAAADCRLHLHTRVGNFRISTVGDYRPGGAEEAQTIGAYHFYETYVFEVSGYGEHGEGSVRDWTEREGVTYMSFVQAEHGHMAMCRKYAEVVE